MEMFSMESAITQTFQRMLSKQFTALPCVVTNVVGDLKNLQVDVQPLVNFLYRDGTSEPRSQILGVPVIMPGSQSSLISFPVSNGDVVLCVFSMRSLDNFKAGNGQPNVPSDYRKMSERDAIAIPGLFPFAKSVNNPAIRKWDHNTKDVVIAHNIASGTEVEIRLTQNGDVVINTDQKVIVNANSVELTATSLTVDCPNTTWTGNATISGTWTFNGIPFNTHKHTGVTPGSGTSAGPVA